MDCSRIYEIMSEKIDEMPDGDEKDQKKNDLMAFLRIAYEAYAIEHNLLDRIKGDGDLFYECNVHHNESLKECYLVQVDCPYNDNPEQCDGWYINENRCCCGNYKGWSWEDDEGSLHDVTSFSIFSTSPCGQAIQEW